MPLTIEAARQLALALPETQEQEHWGRPAFKVKTKIFATLWPDELRAVLKLTPEAQGELVREDPRIYSPVTGAWGQRGYTNVQLRQVDGKEFAAVLQLAWRRVAPRRLVDSLTRFDRTY